MAIFVLFAFSAGAIDPSPQFKVGGVVLALPAPPGDILEVGDKPRTTVFELLAPSENRLVSAYAAPSVVTRLLEGKAGGSLGTYGLVEVLRRAEYADCSPEAFEQVRKSVQPESSKFASEGLGGLQEEMNLRLKSLDVGKIEIGHPEMLGPLFEKPDALGLGMLITMKQAEHGVTMAGGFGLIRVKQRLLFVYLYKAYEGPNTVSWIGTTLEGWADAIMRANR